MEPAVKQIKFWCPKHKEYEVGNGTLIEKDNSITFQQGDVGYISCPKCDEVAEKKLCVECEKHLATVPYAESQMDWIYGFTSNICQCCYVKKVQKVFDNTQENLKKQKEELEKNPCKEG